MDMVKMPKISVNQNVLVLIVGLIGLGFSEMYGLKTLYIFSFIISAVIGVSVIISMIWYTYRYMKNKAIK